jgi:hypothetical protein
MSAGGWLSFRPRCSNLFPGQDAYGHLAVDRAGLRVGGDVEPAAFEADVSKLIGAGPILVPGDVDVMRDGLAVEGKGSGVGYHRLEERGSFRVGQLCQIGRLGTPVRDDDCTHPAVPQRRRGIFMWGNLTLF